MAPTIHKPVHVKPKQQNATNLHQLYHQQKFISLVSLMNKLISMIKNEKTRPIYTEILMNQISQQ